MLRKTRIDAPGALHHVIGRGIERWDIFIDDRDRESILERLGDIHLNPLCAGLVPDYKPLR